MIEAEAYRDSLRVTDARIALVRREHGPLTLKYFDIHAVNC